MNKNYTIEENLKITKHVEESLNENNLLYNDIMYLTSQNEVRIDKLKILQTFEIFINNVHKMHKQQTNNLI